MRPFGLLLFLASMTITRPVAAQTPSEDAPPAVEVPPAPATDEPPPDAPSVAPEADNRLHLTIGTDTPGTTLLLVPVLEGSSDSTGVPEGRYRRVCTAPCEADFERGNYTFAVVGMDGTSVVVPRVELDQNGHLDIGVTQRRRARRVRLNSGFIVVGIGLLSMVVVMKFDCDACYGTGLGIGIGTAVVGGGLLWAGTWTRDQGHVTFSRAR